MFFYHNEQNLLTRPTLCFLATIICYVDKSKININIKYEAQQSNLGTVRSLLVFGNFYYCITGP